MVTSLSTHASRSECIAPKPLTAGHRMALEEAAICTSDNFSPPLSARETCDAYTASNSASLCSTAKTNCYPMTPTGGPCSNCKDDVHELTPIVPPWQSEIDENQSSATGRMIHLCIPADGKSFSKECATVANGVKEPCATAGFEMHARSPLALSPKPPSDSPLPGDVFKRRENRFYDSNASRELAFSHPRGTKTTDGQESTHMARDETETRCSPSGCGGDATCQADSDEGSTRRENVSAMRTTSSPNEGEQAQKVLGMPTPQTAILLNTARSAPSAVESSPFFGQNILSSTGFSSETCRLSNTILGVTLASITSFTSSRRNPSSNNVDGDAVNWSSNLYGQEQKTQEAAEGTQDLASPHNELNRSPPSQQSSQLHLHWPDIDNGCKQGQSSNTDASDTGGDVHHNKRTSHSYNDHIPKMATPFSATDGSTSTVIRRGNNDINACKNCAPTEPSVCNDCITSRLVSLAQSLPPEDCLDHLVIGSGSGNSVMCNQVLEVLKAAAQSTEAATLGGPVVSICQTSVAEGDYPKHGRMAPYEASSSSSSSNLISFQRVESTSPSASRTYDVSSGSRSSGSGITTVRVVRGNALPQVKVQDPQASRAEEEMAQFLEKYPGKGKLFSALLSCCGADTLHVPHSVRQTTTLDKRRDRIGERYVNEYRILRLLGRGSCGKVQLAYDTAEDRLVAIKHVRRADMSKKRIGGPTEQQKRYSAFLCEVAIMKTLRHEHIVSLYEVIDDPDASELYLVMQYIDNGPIAHIQVEAGTERVCAPIPPDELAGYTMQMLSGLKYLHQLGVVHRDIKPANILVSKDKKVYLVDFGVAETFDTSYRERRERLMEKSMAMSVVMSVAGEQVGGPQVLGTKGTLLFIAPELWRRERSFGKPVDMWAMGVTLYTLLTGRLPFRNLEEITNPTLPVIPTEYGEGWSQLLRGLLHRDGAQRLTVQQAIAISAEIGRCSVHAPCGSEVSLDPHVLLPSDDAEQQTMKEAHSSGPSVASDSTIQRASSRMKTVKFHSRALNSVDNDTLGNTAIRPCSVQSQSSESDDLVTPKVRRVTLALPPVLPNSPSLHSRRFSFAGHDAVGAEANQPTVCRRKSDSTSFHAPSREHPCPLGAPAGCALPSVCPHEVSKSTLKPTFVSFSGTENPFH